ncbi:hypothetical protein Ancab_021405 [Ancistrocladus abbreviatus]
MAIPATATGGSCTSWPKAQFPTTPLVDLGLFSRTMISFKKRPNNTCRAGNVRVHSALQSSSVLHFPKHTSSIRRKDDSVSLISVVDPSPSSTSPSHSESHGDHPQQAVEFVPESSCYGVRHGGSSVSRKRTMSPTSHNRRPNSPNRRKLCSGEGAARVARTHRRWKDTRMYRRCLCKERCQPTVRARRRAPLLRR